MLSIRRTLTGIRTMVLAAATIACGASTSQAGLTELRSTPHSTEQNQAQIFSHTYGGTFVPSGTGFTNGVINITRVDDLSDTTWTGHKVTLDPVASFSRSEQALGLLYTQPGIGTESLFSVDQFGYLPSNPLSIDLAGKDYRFTLDNSATHLRSTSFSLNNSSDQLITYKVNGLKGPSTYMLFWEDTPLAQSDHDFNDLVVKAQFDGQGGPHAVPLPPAVYMALLTFAGIGVMMYVKRRKAQMA